MSRNLIKAGLIQVQKFCLAKLKKEIARLRNMAESDILEVQCWPNQLWINIAGMGGRLISYRSLPSWLNQGISALNNTQNLEELAELGAIISDETKNHHYEAEAVEKMRQVYAQQRDHLTKLQPAIEHQRAGQRWLENWEGILNHCEDTKALEYLAVQIKVQSQKYTDLPEIIAKLRQLWSNRWQELDLVLSS